MTVYPRFVPLGVLPDLALVAGLLALWTVRRTPWGRAALFAVAYFLILLAPVLGLIDSSYTAWFSPVADHYQYLAIISISALAGAALSLLPERGLPDRLTGGLALVAVLAFVTVRQQAPYRSEIALFARLLLDAPYSPRAYTLMGSAQMSAGRYQESIENLESAIAIDPNDALAHSNLCAGLLHMGRFEEGALECRETLRLDPHAYAALNNLAIMLGFQGRWEESSEFARRALQINPLDPVTHYNLALALEKMDRTNEAIPHLQEALRLKPGFPEATAELQAVLTRDK